MKRHSQQKSALRKLGALGLAGLLIVIAIGAAMAQTGTKTPGQETQSALVESMQKTMAGWSTLDPTKVAPFYAKDADLAFFDITPYKYKGWSEYEAGTKAAFAGFQSLQATVANPQVHAQGNLAWGTGEVHMDVTMKDGTKLPLDTRWTLVWEKRGKDWLIVHEHVSVPLQMDIPSQPAPSKP
jgi:ketosteroid isomerase-like protein